MESECKGGSDLLSKGRGTVVETTGPILSVGCGAQALLAGIHSDV